VSYRLHRIGVLGGADAHRIGAVARGNAQPAPEDGVVYGDHVGARAQIHADMASNPVHLQRHVGRGRVAGRVGHLHRRTVHSLDNVRPGLGPGRNGDFVGRVVALNEKLPMHDADQHVAGQ
jgi:hypothetical protein